MSRVMDKLIQLKKEYASYGEYDGIYAEDVQEIIDELLNDLNEDEKSQKILYQPQAYGTPWLCPACGAWIDVGQHSIEIDGYADIYKGALSLIDDVVRQVNDILTYLDIETTELEGNTPCVRLNPNEIVRTLFAPYVGGTSTHNLKNALGIEDDELVWEVKAEQYEW